MNSMGWVTFSSRIKKYINLVIDFEIENPKKKNQVGFCFEVVVVLGTT